MSTVYISKAEIEKAKKLQLKVNSFGQTRENKVAAIKYVRDITKAGLKEAKEFVESGYSIPFVSGSTTFDIGTSETHLLSLADCFEETLRLIERLDQMKKRIEELSSQGG